MKIFIKKYWLLLLLAIILPLLTVYLWFIFDGGFPSGAGLKKEHWLAFTGGYLSFVGTVFLGLVSLWQNDKANEVNENNYNYIERQEKYKPISDELYKIGEELTTFSDMLANESLNVDKSTLCKIQTKCMALKDIKIDLIIPSYYEKFEVVKLNKAELKKEIEEIRCTAIKCIKKIDSRDNEKSLPTFTIKAKSLIALQNFFYDKLYK